MLANRVTSLALLFASFAAVKSESTLACGNDTVVLGYSSPLHRQNLSDVSLNLTFTLSGRGFGNVLNPTVAASFTQKDSEKSKVFGTSESGTKAAPDWNKIFWFIWKNGTEQKWHFQVIEHLQSRVRKIGTGELDVDKFVESSQHAEVTLSGGDHREGKKILVQRTTPIKFKLSARNLPKVDEVGSKNDPYVEVYFRRGKNGPNTKFFTTSRINNVDDADWADIIQFDNCQVAVDQYLYFKVRDHDRITKDDLLGEAVLSIDEFLNSEGCLVLPLHKSGNAIITFAGYN